MTTSVGNEFDSPMYKEAAGQFDRVARLMGLDDNVADRLRALRSRPWSASPSAGTPIQR